MSTGRRTLVLVGFAVLLVAGTFVSATVGQLPVSMRDVAGALLHGIGIDTSWRPDDTIIEQTLLQIRFPRVTMSILVGATLAVAGAVMQAIFGNPLAEPGVVGVSAGAALGAAAAIAFGLTAFGGWAVAIMAFAGGFAATVLVYATARVGGRTEVVTLLLTGIAVNAFAGAGLALVMFAADTGSREQIVFWQLGSMNGSRWSEVLIVGLIGLPTCLVGIALARKYDLLSLGERTAAHLGLRVERLRVGSILLVALLTGVAVAFAGIISFVGLVVPHLVRMLLGPSHRTLLVASMLGGAALLVWADLLARTLVTGSDLPIGLLTSLIGGPFFFYLVRTTRAKAGGWA
ncbi:iron ABC transporter permease [Aeromicrobium duanguangcaii]|uniref:Iron ABC transporter permease n=1 Tax=Aeromicrobium duanguangcaii TaxID=2968086 RepID=A0ABY5KC36_9ACTN|nr:iron ABC transporter permease [Aeromicrobium duanguangcaii]UUI68029.1 iron ABC transporter permease [Aeromicrobium duanguangcaii]